MNKFIDENIIINSIKKMVKYIVQRTYEIRIKENGIQNYVNIIDNNDYIVQHEYIVSTYDIYELGAY